MNDNEHKTLKASNDNAGGACETKLSPALLRLARTMGQQAAREWLDSLKAANDNQRSAKKPKREP